MTTHNQQRTYYLAKFRQLQNWVDGKSEHNEISGECCPDLSCCFPGTFTPGPDARRSYLKSQMKQHLRQKTP